MQKSPYFRQGQYNSFYGMPLYIAWHLTDMCNYKYSYCFYQWDKSIRKERFSTLTQLQATVKHIASLNRPDYYITLAGEGEPTIHPHFFEIIDSLHKSLKGRLIELQWFILCCRFSSCNYLSKWNLCWFKVYASSTQY